MIKKILIIEDDVYINNLIKEILSIDNYLIYQAYSGTEGLLLLKDNIYDLIILDLMLPGIDGKSIINKYKNIPIIVVSAKEGLNDKVSCLNMGARDYITKPFATEELIARVRVQLRNNFNTSLRYKDLELLNDKHTLLVNNNEVMLTKTEYYILEHLILNQEKIVSKNTIIDRLSLYQVIDENSLRVHISNIRKKIKKYSNIEYIESIWGIGLRLKS